MVSWIRDDGIWETDDRGNYGNNEVGEYDVRSERKCCI